MDKETAKRLLREQRAGYEALEKLETEELRRATFHDRLRAFKEIIRFAQRMPQRDTHQDDDEVTAIWSRIRARYGRTD